MNAPLLRRGACPTLRAPMQTGDGLLARLYPVDGGLTAAQLVGLAEAAGRHGNGILEITQRGSLQVRGLSAASTPLLAAEVDALGISVRDGVPVETGPLGGLDPGEIADPRPLAEAIRGHISKRELAMRLGPKVTVVVDGGGRSGLSCLKADVRVGAEPGATWRVSIHSIGGTVVSGACPSDQAAELALAALERVADIGRDARAGDLAVSEVAALLKVTGVAATLQPPSGLPAISPSRGEITPVAWSRPTLGEERSLKLPISPLEGEMAGRPKGGRGPLLALRDGHAAMFVSLPFGNIEASELAAFASAADAAGASEFRLAPQRSLIALCPSEPSAQRVLGVARTAGLVVDAGDVRSSIVACPGAPACASGHTPARDLARRIAVTLPALLDLHISGCAKRCAKPSHEGLTLVGTPDRVALVMDGPRGPSTLAHVAKERAEAAIGRVAALVAAERRMGENDRAALRRIGASRLADAFVRDA